MTRKQCCFPMCLCSSDSRPIEISWWSSLKIIGPIIIFTGKAAMRASKTEIMTAHSGCTVERQSAIMGNFWLSSPHLSGCRGGCGAKLERSRKGHLVSVPFGVLVLLTYLFCLKIIRKTKISISESLQKPESGSFNDPNERLSFWLLGRDCRCGIGMKFLSERWQVQNTRWPGTQSIEDSFCEITKAFHSPGQLSW